MKYDDKGFYSIHSDKRERGYGDRNRIEEVW